MPIEHDVVNTNKAKNKIVFIVLLKSGFHSIYPSGDPGERSIVPGSSPSCCSAIISQTSSMGPSNLLASHELAKPIANMPTTTAIVTAVNASLRIITTLRAEIFVNILYCFDYSY